MFNHLVALAFVPPEDVMQCYESLMDEPFFVENSDVLVEFIQYFERTWICTVVRRRQIPAMFEIGLWNCFHSVLEGLPKTNNYCEGFHNGFSGTLGAAHPTIYKLIDAMKEEHEKAEMKIEQMLAGKSLPSNKSRRILMRNYDRLLSFMEVSCRALSICGVLRTVWFDEYFCNNLYVL